MAPDIPPDGSPLPGLDRGPRVLLYSHDSVGLGHLRRTLSVAATLAERFPGARQVVATGSACATQFALPPGLDVVKLPSVGKDVDGAYSPRFLRDDLPSVVRLRRALLLELTKSFRPDLLVVDHKVLGVADELRGVLEQARAAGAATLLGVRDIIDDPAAVAREWGRPAVREALREGYDRVCVYGCPEVFDPRVAYPIPPELGRRLTFTGYLVRPGIPLAFRPVPRLRPLVLVTVGGGEDGAERVELALEALDRPRRWDALVVLGPLLDPARARHLKRRARELQGVAVHTFYEDLPRLLRQTSAVVSMAGYNSVAEILRHRLPAVLLPRTAPRREQLLRASRMAELGLARCLVEPDADALFTAIEEALARGRLTGPLPSLDGCARLMAVVEELLGAPRSALTEVAT